jgi:hypothetical protein
MLRDAIWGQSWRYNFGAKWYWAVMRGTWKFDSWNQRLNSVHRIFRANFFAIVHTFVETKMAVGSRGPRPPGSAPDPHWKKVYTQLFAEGTRCMAIETNDRRLRSLHLGPHLFLGTLFPFDPTHAKLCCIGNCTMPFFYQSCVLQPRNCW